MIDKSTIKTKEEFVTKDIFIDDINYRSSRLIKLMRVTRKKLKKKRKRKD